MKQLTLRSLFLISSACFLQMGCHNNDTDEPKSKILSAQQIKKLIPHHVKDSQSWANDISSISDELNVEKTPDNMCSVIAIVDQESNFVADPVVPGLGAKAAKEINIRLTDKLGSTMAGYFEKMLRTQPDKKDNYLSQIKRVKTERQLDQLYREMFSYYSTHYHISAFTGAAKLVGKDLAERFNPINTLGSMQVHINYAKEHKKGFADIDALRDSLYTQYGGLYYGISRLMVYQANYDKAIYRFADYNSGMYSSRNASIQKMVSILGHTKLSYDGDLLSYNKDGDALSTASLTEIAINQLFAKDPNAPSKIQIRSDLQSEKTEQFEKTQTYTYIMNAYSKLTGKAAPYAIMPQVVISGPKLSRDYNTNWYADKVNARYVNCINSAKRQRLL